MIGKEKKQKQKAERTPKHRVIESKPRWRSVALIYRREMLDQLRDRRTLFTIAVLPILLYPLLGMLLMQISQFKREHPISVCVLGREHLNVDTPLFREDGFAEAVDEGGGKIDLVHYDWGTIRHGRDVKEETAQWIQDGRFDVILVIPPEFLDSSARSNQEAATLKLLYDVTSDESRIAHDRVLTRLNRWQNQWVRGELAATGVSEDILTPFRLDEIDVAPTQSKSAAFWSKMLPFIMLVWALTGAFYPAIDLVAGEKERGTLETLLCSPASRGEIVWGKLGAVATASMVTSMLNCCSMLLTSSLIFNQISLGAGPVVGSPPLVPMLWLFVALIPLSVLFSAVALAAAALAKSSKEGQYYLMPLMMITLPLVMIPMVPGTELSIGNSLIPVTGMFLLVRSLIEGDYLVALLHLPSVLGVTILCLWFAMNWARQQFEDEAVLFGSQEPFSLNRWLSRGWQHREPIPSRPASFLCAAVVMIALFFAKLSGGDVPVGDFEFAKLVVWPQFLLILAPAVIFSLIASRRPLRALRLNKVPLWMPLAAIALGICFHPTYVALGGLVNTLYPLSEQAIAALKPLTEQMAAMPWVVLFIVIALTPAVCEEIAFRGFIFSGLSRGDRHWGAVAITAVLFGASHGVLQQSICATLMGVLLGYIAYRTGSVYPGIFFHLANNAMSVSLDRLASSDVPGVIFFFDVTEDAVHYQQHWTVLSFVLATGIIYLMTKGSIKSGEVCEDSNKDLTKPIESLSGV